MTHFQLFKASMQNKRKDIDQLLSAELEKRVKENREKLSPIVQCILLCGKNNQALRGHRDDSTQNDEQQGNFKDVIEFRIDSGDVKLKEHIETADKKYDISLKNNAKSTYYCQSLSKFILLSSKFIRNAILTNIILITDPGFTV